MLSSSEDQHCKNRPREQPQGKQGRWQAGQVEIGLQEGAGSSYPLKGGVGMSRATLVNSLFSIRLDLAIC